MSNKIFPTYIPSSGCSIISYKWELVSGSTTVWQQSSPSLSFSIAYNSLGITGTMQNLCYDGLDVTQTYTLRAIVNDSCLGSVVLNTYTIHNLDCEDLSNQIYDTAPSFDIEYDCECNDCPPPAPDYTPIIDAIKDKKDYELLVLCDVVTGNPVIQTYTFDDTGLLVQANYNVDGTPFAGTIGKCPNKNYGITSKQWFCITATQQTVSREDIVDFETNTTVGILWRDIDGVIVTAPASGTFTVGVCSVIEDEVIGSGFGCIITILDGTYQKAQWVKYKRENGSIYDKYYEVGNSNTDLLEVDFDSATQEFCTDCECEDNSYDKVIQGDYTTIPALGSYSYNFGGEQVSDVMVTNISTGILSVQYNTMFSNLGNSTLYVASGQTLHLNTKDDSDLISDIVITELQGNSATVIINATRI